MNTDHTSFGSPARFDVHVNGQFMCWMWTKYPWRPVDKKERSKNSVHRAMKDIYQHCVGDGLGRNVASLMAGEPVEISEEDAEWKRETAQAFVDGIRRLGIVEEEGAHLSFESLRKVGDRTRMSFYFGLGDSKRRADGSLRAPKQKKLRKMMHEVTGSGTFDIIPSDIFTSILMPIIMETCLNHELGLVTHKVHEYITQQRFQRASFRAIRSLLGVCKGWRRFLLLQPNVRTLWGANGGPIVMWKETAMVNSHLCGRCDKTASIGKRPVISIIKALNYSGSAIHEKVDRYLVIKITRDPKDPENPLHELTLHPVHKGCLKDKVDGKRQDAITRAIGKWPSQDAVDHWVLAISVIMDVYGTFATNPFSIPDNLSGSAMRGRLIPTYLWIDMFMGRLNSPRAREWICHFKDLSLMAPPRDK